MPVAAEVAKVEDATKALETAPTPTTPAEADTLAENAAALAVLASALDTRLRSTDAFEVISLPASVRTQYRDIAAAATSRSTTVQASAAAMSAEFVRAAAGKGRCGRHSEGGSGGCRSGQGSRRCEGQGGGGGSRGRSSAKSPGGRTSQGFHAGTGTQGHEPASSDQAPDADLRVRHQGQHQQ